MSAYLHAAASLVSPSVLVFMVLGTIIGMILSSIPGLGPSVTIALLLPVTFGLHPLQALIFLTSLYQASEYGGSITAITAATPGTSNAAALVLDGYEMSRQGRPGKALGYSLWSAATASLVATVALLAIAAPISDIVLKINSVELASLEFFALTLVAVLMRGSALKGLISVGVGLLASTVGTDLLSGQPRFTLGVPQLLNGIPLVPLLLGLFAVSEAVRLLTTSEKEAKKKSGDLSPVRNDRQIVWLSFKEWRETLPFVSLGTVVGFVLGLLPGLAGTVPPWISYSMAKGVSKDKKAFGRGTPRGIVAPEATNGAVMHATMVPAFFLGIPGTPSSALILGAMTIVGLTPGPLVFAQHKTVVLAVFEALLLSVVILWLTGIFVTSIWANVIRGLNRKVLGSAIVVLAIVGAYASSSEMFGVTVALVAGAVGYILRNAGFSIPAIVIAFVIGPGFENNFRTALTYSHGNFATFVQNPVSAVILALAVGSLALSVVSSYRARLSRNAQVGPTAAGASEERDEERQ